MKPYVASHHLEDTCLWKVWQKWCVVSVTKKNNTSATHFFALSPKPMARFRWKRATVQASTLPAKFHPNPSKFPRCISENDVPGRYNNRRPIMIFAVSDMLVTACRRMCVNCSFVHLLPQHHQQFVIAVTVWTPRSAWQEVVCCSQQRVMCVRTRRSR